MPLRFMTDRPEDIMKRLLTALIALTVLIAGAAYAEDAPTGGVASEEEMSDVIDIVGEDMTPVTAEMLNDGEYDVEVDSSSSMFKIVGCVLRVENGAMSVRLYMKSEAYSYMYAGPAEEAAAADIGELSPLSEDGEGRYFALTVDALDAGYICAAYSVRKQVWYPRTLVFRSDSLPLDAFRPEYVNTVETLGLSDGEYECEAVLGGQGKAEIVSPVKLTVANGEAAARIVFTTSKIDYVIVNGEKILPADTTDGAAFDIPVQAFDRPIAIIVDSTAIKPATEVPYSITFISETLK